MAVRDGSEKVYSGYVGDDIAVTVDFQYLFPDEAILDSDELDVDIIPDPDLGGYVRLDDTTSGVNGMEVTVGLICLSPGESQVYVSIGQQASDRRETQTFVIQVLAKS